MDAVLEAPLPALQPSLGPEAMPSPQTSAPFLAAAERQAGFPRCGMPGTRSGTAVSAGCVVTCGSAPGLRAPVQAVARLRVP